MLRQGTCAAVLERKCGLDQKQALEAPKSGKAAAGGEGTFEPKATMRFPRLIGGTDTGVWKLTAAHFRGGSDSGGKTLWPCQISLGDNRETPASESLRSSVPRASERQRIFSVLFCSLTRNLGLFSVFSVIQSGRDKSRYSSRRSLRPPLQGLS